VKLSSIGVESDCKDIEEFRDRNKEGRIKSWKPKASSRSYKISKLRALREGLPDSR
jgi:hypothetical protein